MLALFQSYYAYDEVKMQKLRSLVDSNRSNIDLPKFFVAVLERIRNQYPYEFERGLAGDPNVSEEFNEVIVDIGTRLLFE